MRHEVTVDGRTLTVDRPYSRRPRILVDGAELPQDAYGNYVLAGEDGRPRRVAATFDLRQLAPRVQIGDRRMLTVPPLPRGAWLLLGPILVLVLVGGALGAGIGVGAALLAATQLRRPDGGRRRFVVAGAIEVAAVVLFVAAVALIRAR